MKTAYLVINLASRSTTVNGDFTEYYTVVYYLQGDETKWEWTACVDSARLFNTEEEAIDAISKCGKVEKYGWNDEKFMVQKTYVKKK